MHSISYVGLDVHKTTGRFSKNLRTAGLRGFCSLLDLCKTSAGDRIGGRAWLVRVVLELEERADGFNFKPQLARVSYER